MEIKNDKLTMWRVVVPKLWGKVVFTLPCHHTMTGLPVRITDNNNSPHGKFHGFLSAFSSKFSDLNFASYVLSSYSYVTSHAVSARPVTRATNQPIRQMSQLTNQPYFSFFFRTNQNLAGKHFAESILKLKSTNC